ARTDSSSTRTAPMKQTRCSRRFSIIGSSVSKTSRLGPTGIRKPKPASSGSSRKRCRNDGAFRSNLSAVRDCSPLSLTADHRAQAGYRANYRLRQPFSGDLYWYAFADRIKNGRILLSDPAEFLQLLVRNVSLDSELHANLLVAVSNALIDAEESAEVDIAVN